MVLQGVVLVGRFSRAGAPGQTTARAMRGGVAGVAVTGVAVTGVAVTGVAVTGAVIGEIGAIITSRQLPPATWRSGAENQAELPGGVNGAVCVAEALAAAYRPSASSSSAASAHESVPSRSPIQMGSLSLKGVMEPKRASRPLEVIGMEKFVEVMS